MLNFSCFVVYFSLIACSSLKKPQHEQKSLIKKESYFVTPFLNKVDVQNIKFDLMEKLKTVEADPLYDYKDMWWKTIRRIQSTEPTLIASKIKLAKKGKFDENNAAVIKIGGKKRINEVSTVNNEEKPIKKSKIKYKNGNMNKTGANKNINEALKHNIEDKTTFTKAYRPYVMTRMKKYEVSKMRNENLLSIFKPLNSAKVRVLRNSSLNNATTKNLNIDEYVYSDVLLKQNLTLTHENKDPLKDILLTNDSKVISDIQATDVINLVKIYNDSMNAIKDIGGINTTNLINYYNFTAKQFGNVALQNYSYLFENYETKSTWRLIKPGHTAWLHPTEQHPYFTEPTVTTESPTDFVTFLMVYKRKKNEGYFSTFLTHLFKIISEKQEKYVRLLCLAMVREYNVLTKQNKFIHDFGPAFLKVLHDFSVTVAESPADYIKAYASLLYNYIPKRKEMIVTGVTSIIDYIDTLFNDKEGTTLFEALELVSRFPNTTENAYEILRVVSEALFAPYLRLSGTIKAQILIDSINSEIQRAHEKSLARREYIFRDGNIKYQSRLHIFTNRTRFAVVERGLSNTNGDNKIKRLNKHTKNTEDEASVEKKYDAKKDFGNVIENEDVYERTTMDYDPFKKHKARFKIVTREPDTVETKQNKKYVEQIPTKDKHPNIYDKHPAEMDKDAIDGHFKLNEVFKNIYNDFMYFSRNKSVPRNPTLTKRTTRKTVHYRPKYIIESFTTTPKLLKINSHLNLMSKTDNRYTTRKSKFRYNKMPSTNTILENKFNTGISKQTKLKRLIKHNDNIIKPKYELDDSDIKSNKKTDGLKHVSYNNAALDKVTGHSSYSYEENDLKFRLNDALNHDRVYDNNFRKHNVNPEGVSPVNQFSSYSNEETALKSNIYKVIGFKHVARNASFDFNRFPQTTHGYY